MVCLSGCVTATVLTPQQQEAGNSEENTVVHHFRHKSIESHDGGDIDENSHGNGDGESWEGRVVDVACDVDGED